MAVQTEERESLSIDEQIETLSLVKKLESQVSKYIEEIKDLHSHSRKSVLEIGEYFYKVRLAISSVPEEVRRVHRVPSFTAWMNKTAPKECGMTERTAWHYYRNYAETLASGLKPEVIASLAPDLLKSEKARKAMRRVLSANPEIVDALNDAQKPSDIKRIAANEVIQEALKKLTAKPKPPIQQVEKAIVTAYRKRASEMTVEDLLEEITSGVQNALVRMGVRANVTAEVERLGKRPPSRSVEPGQSSLSLHSQAGDD